MALRSTRGVCNRGWRRGRCGGPVGPQLGCDPTARGLRGGAGTGTAGSSSCRPAAEHLAAGLERHRWRLGAVASDERPGLVGVLAGEELLVELEVAVPEADQGAVGLRRFGDVEAVLGVPDRADAVERLAAGRGTDVVDVPLLVRQASRARSKPAATARGSPP